MKLSPSNIVRGIDGDYWLITSRQKTEVAVKVPLLPKALEIINKYKNHPKAVANRTLFPNISNQKLNSYLKKLLISAALTNILPFT